MADQTQGEIIINVRHAVRGMMTCALNDDMPSAVNHAKDLAAQPGVAAQALLELGEILDFALHAHCRAAGTDVLKVWQSLCAQLSEYDQQVGDAMND